MNVILDNNILEAIPTGIRTLGALIHHVGSLPQLKQRVIQSITINGNELQGWDAGSSLPLPSDASVRITTRPLAHVLMETALSCRDYLPRLQEGAVSVAADFHQGRQAEAFDTMNDLIEGLNWYTEFLRNILTLRPREGERAASCLSSLNRILAELVGAWERQDFTLLADLLEYELVPELEAGTHYIEHLVANLSADLGNGR